MIFMLKYAFTHIFSLRMLLLDGKYLIGMLFDLEPDKLLSPTLYRIRGAAHVILKVREKDAMNDALFAPLSNYRERASKLTGISNKKLSCIKSKLEKVVLAHRKPRSDGIEPSDIDKFKI